MVLIKVCKLVLRYNMIKARNVKDLQNTLVYQQAFENVFPGVHLKCYLECFLFLENFLYNLESFLA